MTSFTFNVISEKDDKRIPISVAGQVMVDVQDLFRHIGEYIISREMRFQEAVPAKLAEKFTIYADKSGGVVLEASTEAPETRGYGNVVEDALTLLEATLDSLGSGTGGYWVDDNFRMPSTGTRSSSISSPSTRTSTTGTGMLSCTVPAAN